MKRGLILTLMLIGLLALGCRHGAQLDKPPDIQYGVDICDQCRMIISEARFAAAYVTQEGETRRFDDVGDMLLFHQEHQEEVAVFWVHDYETEEWVRADQAFFVMSEELITPMGYGIVAFADRERAEALAAETQGMVMTFEELAARFAGEEEMHEHMHQHGSETEAGEEHR